VDEAEPPLSLRVRAGNEQAKSTKGKKWSKMTRPW